MSYSFSAQDRSLLLQQCSSTSFDVLVIGGGITGAGIALDAASRGLKVCLVDMQDFGAGTSSRSTKLIHGGLRYLKQLEFGLVAEVGRERAILYRNAPHLVRPEPMLLPITRKGSLGRLGTRLGMWLYEYLAGVKKEERYRALNAAETLGLEPMLRKENLLGGILYHEYRTDDARLCLSVVKTAVAHGALAISYLKVIRFVDEEGKLIGVEAEDQLGKKLQRIQATYIINASGPWVDELDGLDAPHHAPKLQLTKGVHLVVAHARLPIQQALYIDARDGRMIFLIPRDGKTYIGTTDTFYNGDKQHPPITEEDKRYLLKCVNDFFDGPPLQSSDLESGWAGLRPLIRKAGKSPSAISRRDELFEWPSGLITIAGGKLSGYRTMAKRVVDVIAKRLLQKEQRPLPACSTDQITLSGGDPGEASFSEFLQQQISIGNGLGISAEEVQHLVQRYGSGVGKIFDLLKALPAHSSTDLPLIVQAELMYSIDQEMCLHPCDFFIRRTGLLYFDVATVKRYQSAILQQMQVLFAWPDALREQYALELQQAIDSTRF